MESRHRRIGCCPSENQLSSFENHFSWDPVAFQIHAPPTISSQQSNLDPYFRLQHRLPQENPYSMFPAASVGIGETLERSMNRLSLSSTLSTPQYSQFHRNNWFPDSSPSAISDFGHVFIPQEQRGNSVPQTMRTESAHRRVSPWMNVGHALSSSIVNMQNGSQDLIGSSNFSAVPFSNSCEQFCFSVRQNSSNGLYHGSQNPAELRMNIPPRRRFFSGVGSENPFSSLHSMNNRRVHHQLQLHAEELRGRVAFLAKDQNGRKLLEAKFSNGTMTPEELEIIFLEVKDQLLELSVHHSANYIVQKFFAFCKEDQISQLLFTFLGSQARFKELCMDMHGTRSVQELVKNISTRYQRSLILSVLRSVARPFALNTSAYHNIVHDLVDHFIEVATNRSGCCVLKRCLAYAEPQAKERILAEITANALLLSEDEFGNYVVQYSIADMEEPCYDYVMENVAAMLEGNFVSLSMNKYASNVVEKLLIWSSKRGAMDITARIVNEIMNHPNFVKVLQDNYGNFVAQTALLASKGELRRILVSRIESNYPLLHSHPFGEKVLGRIKGRRRQVLSLLR
ncbi:hypothetical protein SLEP1_g50535 [Rubroshorea leprosula]|uniref:PUM-HD domain-containing protein n=2 Tax=Rubroshorea leprosula TaxID=152421 RepID=A0AAV5M2R5_9ROSI|nr:hypothetical protein SLEP1_g50535 [Rubroshorea leprosula]